MEVCGGVNGGVNCIDVVVDLRDVRRPGALAVVDDLLELRLARHHVDRHLLLAQRPLGASDRRVERRCGGVGNQPGAERERDHRPRPRLCVGHRRRPAHRGARAHVAHVAGPPLVARRLILKPRQLLRPAPQVEDAALIGVEHVEGAAAALLVLALRRVDTLASSGASRMPVLRSTYLQRQARGGRCGAVWVRVL